MRSGAVIYRVPPQPVHPTRQFRILYQPPGSFEVHVHNNCQCNEYISLRNRVLMDVPGPSQFFVRASRVLAHRIGTWLGTHIPANGEWINRYSGRKLTMYRNAEADLLIDPFGRQDRFIKSFVKPQNARPPVRAKDEPDPRLHCHFHRRVPV